MSSDFDPSNVPITRINKEQMTEILEDVANGGREDSGYCVMDVRGEDEIAYTREWCQAASPKDAIQSDTLEKSKHILN